MRTPTTNPEPTAHLHGAGHGTTERRILDSLAALIQAGVPWHQVGIRQITEGAEISRTAFYDFFRGKNEVLAQLVSRLHDDLRAGLSSLGDGQPAGVDLTELRPLLALIAAYNVAHGPIYRAFLDAAGEDPDLERVWDEVIELSVGLAAAGIQRVRTERPDVPHTPESRSLARTLVLMTERTVITTHRDPGDQAATLEALAQVWERSVFGGPIPERSALAS